MLIESYHQHGYQILSIKEDLTISSDLSELKALVQGYMQKGITDIAFSFTEASYLYTKSISVLVQCLEAIRDRGGTMAIIHPNDDIVDILDTLDFDKIIKIFPTEQDMVPAK
jgi:anti-anti-sigma factor